jgi:hypothetical protein
MERDIWSEVIKLLTFMLNCFLFRVTRRALTDAFVFVSLDYGSICLDVLFLETVVLVFGSEMVVFLFFVVFLKPWCVANILSGLPVT